MDGRQFDNLRLGAEKAGTAVAPEASWNLTSGTWSAGSKGLPWARPKIWQIGAGRKASDGRERACVC